MITSTCNDIQRNVALAVVVLSACTCYYNYLDNSNCRGVRYGGPEVHTYSIFHLRFILRFIDFAVQLCFCNSLLQFAFAIHFCS